MELAKLLSCRCVPPLLLLLMLTPGHVLTQVAVTGCEQPGCIGCDPLGRCTRCTRAIVHGTRQCVTSCPGNYRLVHSDVTGYQGLLCRAHRFLDTLDLTTAELSALVSALLVAAVCIGLAIGAFMYLRLRRKMDPLRERLHRRDTDPVDLERVQFATRLRALRSEMATLLSLLSEPRPPSRYSTEGGTGRSSRHTLRTSQPSSLSSQQEVRRLLVLLAGRGDQQPPADWRRLLGGAERLLREHRRQLRSGGKVNGSAPQIESLPRSTTPRRARPPSARPPSSTARPPTGGSLFSLTQTVIEEEEDDPPAVSSLPPGGVRRHRHRPGGGVGVGRPRRALSGHDRGRRRIDSAPGGLGVPGPAVYVHRVNGGQGAVWGRPGSAAAAGSGRPGSAPLSTAPSGGGSVAPPGLSGGTSLAPPTLPILRPATTEPRPTYRDWPLDRLRHLGQAPPPPRRPSPDPGGGGMTRLSVGSAAPLLWPQRAEGGGLHSDVLEQDGASFGGRYLHPQDLSTVL